MFTIAQIQEAHSGVKSGADFPKYVQELIGLGVLSYDVFVGNGHAEYRGADGFEVKSDAGYSEQKVIIDSNAEKFKHYLKIHQQGETDYLTFCKHAAETGIHKWTVDLQKRTCTYSDWAGNEMIVEKIPG